MVALSGGQTPQQLANFVEYLFGDSRTPFGALRVADGHPAPYNPPSLALEVSNEQCMSAFVSSFAQKIIAMEAAATRYGMGGKLQYVTGSYRGLITPDSHCPAGGPNATLEVLKEVTVMPILTQSNLKLNSHLSVLKIVFTLTFVAGCARRIMLSASHRHAHYALAGR